MFNINWPKWVKLINEAFIPLVDNKSRYLILYGGRGSSKSDFAAKKLIWRCLSEDYFKCVLIRNSYNSIKDSSYEQLKQCVENMGLDELFTFKIQPLEIECVNGNKFICRGLDDSTKLKSLTNYTSTWFEEDIPNEDDLQRIVASIRSPEADYIQHLFTINPEVEGNYQDNYFYKRFFYDNMNDKTFTSSKEIDIDGKLMNIEHTCHHSTYRDNRWIPDEFKASMMALKNDNPYYYTIYSEGEWGNRVAGGLAYRNFTRGTHTNDNEYRNELPLHISFDFNTKPYVSCLISQIDDKKIKVVDLIAGRYPNNTTKKVCEEFVRKYRHHQSGLFIYGDPSGKNQDTRSEEGHNDYVIIEKELSSFRPDNRVESKHPSQKMRLDFINSIFSNNFNNISIEINNNCIELINDFLFQKENSEGGKLKEKVSRNGESYEKYGHMSDCFDYFICSALRDDYEEYIDGPKIDFRETGKNEWNDKYQY